MFPSSVVRVVGWIKIQEPELNRLQNQIDNLSGNIQSFEKEINQELTLFLIKAKETKNQKVAELGKIRQEREKSTQEKENKKKVLGYSLAYKSAKPSEIARRFHLTTKQVEEMLPELDSEI